MKRLGGEQNRRESVLGIYCCIIIPPHTCFKWFETIHIYLLTFSIGAPVQLSRVLCKAAIKVTNRAGILSEGSAEEGFTPKLTQLLAGFRSLQTVELRTIISCWLSVSVLCHLALSLGQFITWQLASSKSARETAS